MFGIKYNNLERRNMFGKMICNECNGNGFVRVPYEEAREEQWANCEKCNSQGEIEIGPEDLDLDKTPERTQ
jgi:DnaJ-class molecular chaperone